MAGRPWTKWYWADWRSDPQLRLCSLAARGLWAEMLALMHEAQPYGHLLISGNAPTDTQLAVLAGAPSDQVPDLLRELETAGVFSRTKQGAIYSRRMTRDEKRARTARKNGQRGGNPTLSKTRENPAWDNPRDNPRDNTQKPDTRYQIPNNPPSPVGDSPPRDDRPAFDRGDGEQPRAVALAKPEPPPPKRNPSRGTRLPSDWTPDAKARQAAADEGLTDDEIDRSAQRFRDYWIAQPSGKGVKCDWHATWRNWVRRDVDDGRVGRGFGRGPQRGGIAAGQGGPQDSSFAASVARAVQRQSPRRAAGSGAG